MERELRPASREERLELLRQGRRCPGIPHHWRPQGLIRHLRHVPRAVKRDVIERDGHRCLCCGDTRGLKVTHIHPRADGGPDTASNLQTLCASCTALKGERCLDFRSVAAPTAAVQPVVPAPAGEALAAA
jgi:5-methylcytosine-specific restriction endonuclease McrA